MDTNIRQSIIPNNGLGGSPPSELQGAVVGHNFIVNNIFTPHAVADLYDLRINFDGKSTVTQNRCKLEIDIGGTQGVIYTKSEDFDISAGVEKQLSFDAMYYSYDTFFLNGGTLYLTVPQEVEIYNITYLVAPRYKRENT